MLAEQIVLGLPYIKNREDGLALWGVLSRNGGLNQGNLKFRLADVMNAGERRSTRVAKNLVPLLQEVGALEDGEFLMELMKVSLSRGTTAITKKVLQYQEVKEAVVGKQAAQYLEMPLKSLSADIRKSSFELLLSQLDFPQEAKNKVLSKLVSQAAGKSALDRFHECFSCLLKAGADPTALCPDASAPQCSIALFLATRASSFNPHGIDFIEALMQSPQWEKVLSADLHHGFAWNWYNSDGNTTALLKGLQAASPVWWEEDPFNVISSALMEAQEGDSPLFEAIKSGVKRKAPPKSIDMPRAISIAEEAIRLACEECADPKPTTGMSHLIAMLMESSRTPRAEKVERLVSFWSKKAPLIATAFEDPKGWRLLCDRVVSLLETSTQSIPEAQVDAFINGLRLDISTDPTRQPYPTRTRRI